MSMASSEWGPEDQEPCLEEADVYKATSSSDFVVVRRVRLFRSRFITYHSYEENKEDNKQWLFSAHCELQPRSAADIREPSTKYVRPRGQWAITTLVKPKSIGTKGQGVRLYTFTLAWPTRWATKGYTSFTFGFRTAEEARHWHARLSGCLDTFRREKAAAAIAAVAAQNSATPSAPNSVNGSLSRVANGGDRSSAGGQSNYSRVNSAAAGPAAAPLAQGLPKASSLGGAQRGFSTESAPQSAVAGSPQAPSPAASLPPPGRHRRSMTEVPSDPAKRTLIFDGSHGPRESNGRDDGTFTSSLPDIPPQSAPATAKTRTRPPALSAPPPPSGPPAAEPSPAGTQRRGVGFANSSSDSDSEAYEEAGDGSGGAHRGQAHTPRRRRSNAGGRMGGGPAGCRPTRAVRARADVRQTKQRWVPYKQVNGVAIYHRRQTAGDAEAGVGGEFMVSTVVRGSPRRCLEALTATCGNTTVLGPATRLEVLQRRQAEDGKEIQRIILQAPGLAGVLCAPRELVVETVFKIDETGPTLVLMFQSCEPPARFVERKPGDPAPGPTGEEEDAGAVEMYQAAPEGARRSWWRTPVSARVQGGYTLAPLEEYSLDSSPEALVTCIMKVDLGGVCGERSWLRLASDLVGWTDAFLDRMLMAVTLLRDEVEQDRFVAQPLNMVASRVTERELASAPEPAGQGLGLGGRSVELSSHTLGHGAAAVGSGALGLRGLQCLTTALTGGMAREASTGGAGAASPRMRRRETDGALMADADEGELEEAAAGGAAGAGAAATCAAAGGGAFGAGAGALAAAEAAALCPSAGPCVQQYETMEDVRARMRRLAFLNPSVWDTLHQPGKDEPFKIRGPTYLKDRKKIPAGHTRFVLGSMDVIAQPPGPVVEHVARFLPSVRESGAPFSIIVHLVIPGTPLLGIVATFVTDRHPSTLGTPPASPMEDEHDWEPFDFVLHKYMNGDTHTRNHMLKLIPHIADGSWMIKQSVGTTPVILGKQLRTIYYQTPQYLEIDIDISANNVASYVTGLVRGATRSLVIDMGFVLEGTTPWELPEALLGTLRLYNLDIRDAKLIDVHNEIPLKPPTLPPRCPAPAPPAAAAPATRGSVTAAAAAPMSGSSSAQPSLSGMGSAPPAVGVVARASANGAANGGAKVSASGMLVDGVAPPHSYDSPRKSGLVNPPSPAQ